MQLRLAGYIYKGFINIACSRLFSGKRFAKMSMIGWAFDRKAMNYLLSDFWKNVKEFFIDIPI